MFTHADFSHLFGNMLFLWVFGLVVEGKLGWKRFLTVYLSIDMVQSALEQSLMILVGGPEGASIGASSAIYGVMAMAAVWAPKNNVNIFFWVFIFFGTFEMTILSIAGLYIGLDFLIFLYEGPTGSSWLHVGGVMVGAPIGVILLKKGIIDCEGWDIFRVYGGDYGSFQREPELAEIEAEIKEKRQLRDSQLLASAPEQMKQFMRDGNYEAAFMLYNKMTLSATGYNYRNQYF